MSNWQIAAAVSILEAKGGPTFYSGDLEQNLRKLEAFGYDGVELHVRSPQDIEEDELMGLLSEVNLSVSALATGQATVRDGLTFTSSDPVVREKTLERIMRHIDLAGLLSCPVIIGYIRGNLPDGPEREKAAHWALEACQKCADYAKQKETTVVVEMINRYEVNWLNSIKEGKEFLQRAKRDNLLLHIDTFHMNIEEPSLEKSILDATGTIGYVHLSDSNRWPPGYGHIDFQAVLSDLEAINYRGYLALEALPLPSADVAAKRGIETIRELM